MDADTSDLRQLSADLAGAGLRVGASAAKVVRDTARDVEATAKSLVPVRTGALRDSISHDIQGDGRSGSMTAEIGPTLRDEKGRPIGLFVEVGTTRAAPRPYLQPALDQHAEAFERALDDILRDLL